MSTRQWVTELTYEDIKYETYNGIAKITINRPEVRNAFRPKTVHELIDAFSRARDNSDVGVIVLTGEGEKHSVQVATNPSADMAATLGKMKFRVLTSWTCSV